MSYYNTQCGFFNPSRASLYAGFHPVRAAATAFRPPRRRPGWIGVQEETGPRRVRIRNAHHAYASQAVMNGGGLTAIGKLLGHRKRATTAIFTHRDAALAATVIARAIGYTAEPSAVRAELPRPEEQAPDLPLLRRRHDRPPLPPWPTSPPLDRGRAGKHKP